MKGVSVANLVDVATGTARPVSTAQTGDAWVHKVSDVVLTSVGQVLNWSDYLVDTMNLTGNNYSVSDVINIPDGTLLTLRIGAFGGGTDIRILHDVTKIRMSNGADFIGLGGDVITFLVYAGILWEHSRSALKTVSALPLADVAYRGQPVTVQGGVGVADEAYICLKKSDDTYDWIQFA
jgi:hypothetical protein